MTLKTSFLTATLIVLGALSASALVHPGGWLTQDELAVIRENVNAQAEPGYGAWLALIEDGADTDYTAEVETISTGVSDFQRDAHAAYTLTIKWVASGEQAYADTAIEIIDDWVNTVTSFDHDQTSLRNGIAGNKMAQAAEILAWGFNGEAGWSTTRIAEAQAWFKEVVYPYTSTGEMRSTNWGTSALAGCMSMAIFCDDQEMFDHACDAYRYGFQNTTDGYCAVTDYIINAEGQCYESGRDQVHTQGGIAHLVETAMTAWNQDVDLVSFADYRLVAGLEYTAKYNVGHDDVSWISDVPNPGNLSVYWPDGISEDGRGKWSPIYIQAATLFERAGQAHPYIVEVIESPTYSLPETHNSDHPGLGDLCFVMDAQPVDATGKKDGFSHEPSTAEAVEAAHLSDRANGYDISSFSPERQAWEKLLDLYLEDFYYTRYLTAKKEGKESSWDYVADVPGLPRVLIIGDSISRGYTLPLRHELEGKANVHRAPQNCSSTVVGMDKLDIWLGDGKWDLITFNFGIHDRRDSSADYETRLRQIIERLKQTDSKLVWITTTPIPAGEPEYVAGAIERLNQVAEQIMTEQKIPVLDLYQAISPNLAQYQRPRNCHFKGSGYDFMGTFMAEGIMAELPGNPPNKNR